MPETETNYIDTRETVFVLVLVLGRQVQVQVLQQITLLTCLRGQLRVFHVLQDLCRVLLVQHPPPRAASLLFVGSGEEITRMNGAKINLVFPLPLNQYASPSGGAFCT